MLNGWSNILDWEWNLVGYTYPSYHLGSKPESGLLPVSALKFAFENKRSQIKSLFAQKIWLEVKLLYPNEKSGRLVVFDGFYGSPPTAICPGPLVLSVLLVSPCLQLCYVFQSFLL